MRAVRPRSKLYAIGDERKGPCRRPTLRKARCRQLLQAGRVLEHCVHYGPVICRVVNAREEAMRGLVVMVVSSALLVGCDSGAGSKPPPGQAVLSTKEDALREIGQLGNILNAREPLFRLESSRSSPLYAPALGSPSVTDCESGSSGVEEGEKVRELAYFSGSEADASYTRYLFQDCASTTGSGESAARDGAIERGELQGSDSTDPLDSVDRYADYGDGVSAFLFNRVVRDELGNAVDEAAEQLFGSTEWRSFDSGWESGSVISRTLLRTAPSSYSLTWRQGENEDPLYVDVLFGPSFRINGPYSYNSSRCAGGSRRIATTEYVDATGGFPESGTLTISAQDEAVTVTFDSDGNARLEFSDGHTATLTADEVKAAMNNPEC